MPVRKDSVHEHTYKVHDPTDETKFVVHCNFCSKRLSNTCPKRIKAHLSNSCEEVPAYVKARYAVKHPTRTLTVEDFNNLSPTERVSVVNGGAFPNSSATSNNKRPYEDLEESSSFDNQSSVQRTPRYSIPRTPTYLKQQLDYAIAMAFYANGIPFRVCESASFKRVFELARSTYIPPTMYQLRHKLLDSCYEKKKDEIVKILKASYKLSLVTDGFSNIRRDHMINYVIVVWDRSGNVSRTFYWKAQHVTSHDGLTARSLYEGIKAVLEEFGPFNFSSVVTDNCNTMKSVWNLVEKEYPWVFANGCAAHGLNLLAMDLIDIRGNKEVVDGAKDIAKFVLNQSKFKTEFKSQQNVLRSSDSSFSKRQLVLPVPTRWYSNFDTLERILENRAALTATFQISNHVPNMVNSTNREEYERLFSLINSNRFWNSVLALKELLSPIIHGIHLLESNSSCLSTVYQVFKELDEIPSIHNYVRRRWDFMHTASMGFAYLLDPTKGVGIDMVDNDRADTIKQLCEYFYVTTINTEGGTEEEIQEKSSCIRTEICNLSLQLQDPNIATKINMDTYSTPLAWWTICGKQYPNLRNIALSVFTVPTLSAASERIWSTFGFIHNKMRNRLTNERVDKLVFLYANSALNDEVEKANNFAMMLDEVEEI